MKPRKRHLNLNEKQKKKLLYTGICTAVLLSAGGVFIASQLWQTQNEEKSRSTSTSHIKKNEVQGGEESPPEPGNSEEKQQPADDLAVSIFEHFGTSSENFLSPGFSNTSDMTIEELRQVVAVAQLAEEPRETAESGNIEYPTPIGNVRSEGWVGPSVSSGNDHIIVGYGDSFDPNNYFDVRYGNDQQATVSVSSIDTARTGMQYLTVRVFDSRGVSDTLTILVYVDQYPEIQSKHETIYVNTGQAVDLLSYVSATDKEDGDLTSKINYSGNFNNQQEGVYQVTYSVTDKHGFTTTKTVPVVVRNQAPIIHVRDIEHELYQPLDPLRFVAVTDYEEGRLHLSEANVISNDIDVTEEGEYTVAIGNVKDSYGKAAVSQSYQVTVVNEAPVMEIPDYELAVFSAFDEEDYLSTVLVSDREDDKANLPVKFAIGSQSKAALDTSVPGEVELQVIATDSKGKESSATGKVKVVNEAPTISGAEDQIIIQGGAFDPLAGISVFDKEESLSLADVEVSGEYDLEVAGVYPITLTLKDSFVSSSVSYLLHVLEAEEN